MQQDALKAQQDEKKLQENLSRIKNKLIVLSGKGGVGKSTVAVNLAVNLSLKGYKTGLLDVDIHGPSVPTMLGLENHKLGNDGEKIMPVKFNENMKAISIGFMLEKPEDAVIWRGPLKYNAIKQFASDVNWGELDYLIVDSPPGTGDEPLSVCQIIKPDAAIVVTTPQDVALTDVRKSITFCNHVNIPIRGVIENMSGFTCPHCGKTVDIFKKGGGERISREMNVPFLGSIPIEIDIMEKGDSGNPFMNNHRGESESVKAFEKIISKITK
ncbi:MAG: Mrp/NBP35 family ATP-binding protein [Spirochaetes bacterium]|nr:Mrp/NBP35 family ATP-binding protein [Spirochaetota bacterium]